MRKIFTLFALLFCSLSAWAESGSCGTNLNWSFNSSTHTLTITGTGAMTDYPTSSENNAPWYDYRADIYTVSLPNGLTHIGNYAFFLLNNLTAIQVPGTVTSIGAHAFHACYALTSAVLQEGVTSIGEFAFNECTHMTTLSLPSTLTSIENYAFQVCLALTDVAVHWTSLSGVTLGSNPFNAVTTSNVRLHVPLGTRSIYAATSPWSGFNIVEQVLPGKFSISASKQIKFSYGNLQYQASTSTWRFAEHQYNYVGNTSVGNVSENDVKCSNTNISSSYSGWIDLFGWATSGNSASGTAYQPYSTSMTGSDYGPAITNSEWNAANSDWGVVNATQLGSGWRTLSSSEWDYLLSSRTNATNLRTFATVCDVKGMIILPDGWTASGVTLSIITTDFTTNTINASDWATLEAQGAVFLPGGGYRHGTGIFDAGTRGCYATSTAADENHARFLDFRTTPLVSTMTNSRHYGYTVRLTHELPAASVTTAPTAKTGLVYTGAAQALINAGIAEGGTMYYSLNNSTWSTAIPTGTDAGNYTVYYKVIGDANHSDFTPASNTITATINVASITTSGSVTTYYSTLASAISAWEANSTLTLLADVTTSSKVEVSNTRTIDLNGYGIKMTGNDCIFLVLAGGDLTMIDSNPTRSTRRFNVSSNVATLADGGAYSFQGGYLTGGRGSTAEDSYRRGGAVFLKGENCQFTMRGGTIIGNRAGFGGGVQVRHGRFVMEGGAIIYNSVADYYYHGGGAVFVDCGSYGGQLTLGGTALIEHNYATGYGNGQVYVDGCRDGALVISGGSPRVINSANTYNINHNSAIMTITGALTAGANLPLSISQPGVITSGYGTYNGNTDPNTFFSVQNSGYTLRLNADGEVHAVTPASVTSAPTAISGLEYTGKAQTLITAGSATGGEMQYKLGSGGAWGTSLPQATEEGDYTVWYKVVGDANHIDVAEASIAVSIAAPSAVVLTANQDPQHTTDYYSTFYHSAIAYELSVGAEAYVATLSGDALNLTKIAEGGQVIPNDNAVILKANNSSITLTPSDATPESFDATNNLQGTDEAMSAPANCYVLSGHSTDEDGDGYYDVTGVGFYQYTGTLKAHRAYVVVADKVSAPKKLRFAYDQTTNVDNVQSDNVQCTKVLRDGQIIIIRGDKEYNVQGQMIK